MLPLALHPAGFSVAWISILGGLDGVGGSAEVVLGHMSYTGRLTCSIGRETCGSSKASSRRHGVAS